MISFPAAALAAGLALVNAQLPARRTADRPAMLDELLGQTRSPRFDPGRSAPTRLRFDDVAPLHLRLTIPF